VNDGVEGHVMRLIQEHGRTDLNLQSNAATH
jgi:hypothetical protein